MSSRHVIPPEKYVQAVTTVARREDAEEMARALVEKRLAACVQIVGPVHSTYRWKGDVKTAREWLCLIKSRGDLYEKLERAILEMHSYETPEIIAVPITAGSKRYLEWLEEQVGCSPG